MTSIRSLAASATLALAALTLGACADGGTPVQPHDAHTALAATERAHMGADVGVTGGWADGKTVTFFYNKPFFCAQPPASGATSGCELGAEAEVKPRGGPIPVLYVMVPLGFRPAESTLQCPVVGSCINHPSTMDLSRVFGAGTENAALPAHSHIIGEEDGNKNPSSGWWEIEVVGVTDPGVWNQVAAGKSLQTVRTLQNAGVGITGDIPTNLFLFFGVRK
jgi:hypothetical protein